MSRLINMGFFLGGRRYFCTGENSLFIDTIDNDKINNKNVHLVNIYYLQGSVLIIFICSHLFNPQNNPMREYYMITL